MWPPARRDADWFARRAAERAAAADRQRARTPDTLDRELLADEIAVHRMGELHHAGPAALGLDLPRLDA